MSVWIKKKPTNKLIKFQFKYFKTNLDIMMTNYHAIPIQAITLGKNPTVVHSFS